MGTKINPKVKKKALDYFFNNNVTYEMTTLKFKKEFSLQTLMRWVKSDKRFTSKRLKWTFYNEGIKSKAIKLYNNDKLNISQICKRLNIASYSLVKFWIRQYEKYGQVSMSIKRLEEQVKNQK